MFNLFGKRKQPANLRPPRSKTGTIRPEDVSYLQQWVVGRAFVEAFIEPETLINEMSVVLVDENGDFTRRRIGGPKGIDDIAKLLDIPVYDVEETGYPQRMRQRIEAERLVRKRAEHQARRAQLERDEPDSTPEQNPE
ncbi:hypothetical protein [Corynebacterium caspium]|uniref:hypothetical protein n=1 Tax=Corynebacterium caspium TaxID=234828 RepID=UPI000475670E|nr:hypothetical protein [Corynebacterium caspium]